MGKCGVGEGEGEVGRGGWGWGGVDTIVIIYYNFFCGQYTLSYINIAL